MSRRIPNPGESKSKFITREFVKQVLPPIPSPGMNVPGGRDIQEADTVLGVVAGGSVTTTIEPYSPFVFNTSSPVTPGSDNLHLSSATCAGVAHTETAHDSNLWNPTWGVALDFITTTQPGRVQIAGWAWMKTTGAIGSTGNSYEIFNRKLFRVWGGSARFYYQSGDWALVRLGTPTMKWLGRTSVSGIALNSVGDVTFYEPNGYTFNPTSIILGCATYPSAIIGQKWVEVSIMSGTRVAQEIC